MTMTSLSARVLRRPVAAPAALRGFTLIELLMVILILVTLCSIMLPTISIARKHSAKTNTMSLMRKVETGLELFKGEMDTYPWQPHADDQPFPEADNRLHWLLAHDLTQVERDDLDADLTVVEEAYMRGGAHFVADADVDPRVDDNDWARQQHAMLASRAAAERAALAIIAGNTSVTGIGADRDTRVVPNPFSRGYAFDFLSLDLSADDVRGDALIDMWGQPLVYNCPVVQGVKPFWGNTSHKSGGQVKTAMDPAFYGMESSGRALATDMASDQRTTAAAPHRFTFELWSSGPDQSLGAERNHPANRDNVSPTDYWSDLR